MANTEHTEDDPRRFISLQSVAARYGVSDMTIRRKVKAGKFPKPVYLFDHLMRWDVRTLDEYDRENITPLL